MSKSRFVRFGAMVLAALVGVQAWATMWSGGGAQNDDGSYKWNDKANWDGKTVPQNSGGIAEFPENTTVIVKMDEGVFTQNSGQYGLMSKLIIPASSHVTLWGNTNGTNSWMQLNNCNLFTELTLDKGARINFNSATLAANAVITVNGASMAQFVASTTLDGVTVTASEGSQVKTGSGAFANFKNGATISLTGAGTHFEAGVTAMAKGAIVATDGVTLAFSSIAAIGQNSIIALTNATATVSGTFYPVTGGTIEVAGKSLFKATSHFKLGGGIHFIIDDSTVNFSGSGNCQICAGSGDVGGDTFTFKGKNPKLILAKNFDVQNVSTAKANGIVLEYEIPEGGYDEVPFQLTHASNKLFGGLSQNANSIGFVRVKVLETSTAITAAARNQQLINAPNGINPFATTVNPFNFALSGDDVPAENFRVTQAGGALAATAADNAREVWVTVGSGEPEPEIVTESKGVATTASVSANNMNITAKATVTQIADTNTYETVWVLYFGLDAESLAPIVTNAVETVGEISYVYKATEVKVPHYFKFVLKTIKDGEVTYSEESAVKSATPDDGSTLFTGGGSKTADGDYVWNDKANWGGSNPPRYSGGVARFPKNANIRINLTEDFFPAGSTQLKKLIVPEGANVTLTGSALGTAAQIYIPDASEVHALTLDNGANVSFSSTSAGATLQPGSSVTAHNGSALHFPQTVKLDGVTLLADSGSSMIVDGNNISDLKGGTSITISGPGSTFTGGIADMSHGSIKGLDGAHFAFTTLNMSSTDSSFMLDASTAVDTGLCYTRAGGTFVFKNGSTAEFQNLFRIGMGTTILIDESVVNLTGLALEMCQGNAIGLTDIGGDTITFKGDSPKLILASGIGLYNSANITEGVTMAFEVPEKGYVESPIQNKGSGVLFGNPTSIKPDGSTNANFIHFKVLSSSPALNKSLDFKSITQLWSTSVGVQKFDFFDRATEGGETAVWEYTTTGYAEVATKASEANELWVTLGENGEIKRRGVEQSKGVADNTSVAVAGRAVTITSAVTLLADAPLTTRCRFYFGTSEDNLVLDETKDVAITETGSFTIDWMAPDFNETYYFKLVLETLNGETVKASEESPVKNGITTDTAAYTWQAVEGDWNGNWSDKAHWTSDQPGLGYPATKDSSADFPEGMNGTVTLDGAYTINKLFFSHPNANITFAPKAGMTAEECTLTIDNGSTDYSANKDVARKALNVTFDGVIIQANRLCNGISTDSTWLLKNGAKCYFRTLTVSGANAWLKVTEGSYAWVWGATSLAIGSANVASELGVLVDNAEFMICNNMQFNADKNAVSFGKFVICGENAVVTNTGMSGRSIYSQSACANNHDIVFMIPEGGFANEPVFSVGKHSTPAFSADETRGYQLGVRFTVDRASPVYGDTGDESKTYKLFESLGGYNSTNVTFGATRPRAQWIEDDLDPHQAISVTVRPAKPMVYTVR